MTATLTQVKPLDRTDAIFLALAYREAAMSSDDPATKNGGVVVKDAVVVGNGANRFPRKVAVTPERLERPLKYEYMVHAEESACVSAGHDARGATLYAPWYACTPCAKTILTHGIRRVVGHSAVREFGELHSPGWTESIKFALAMLEEAGVICNWFDGPVPNAPKILIGGHEFDPAAV